MESEPMRTIDFGKMENLDLDYSYRYCENIAKQKNPFLYHVSRFFKDNNKFKAFCSSYASMRILDDFIDGINEKSSFGIVERKLYQVEIDRWEAIITDCHNGKYSESPILTALTDTFQTFNLPLTPWSNLAKAMRWDVENFRFKTFEEFLEYTEGAAIAPATVCMYVLIAAHNGYKYDCAVKGVDPYVYAKDLAIFCYLTHILRDISSDLELEEKGLIYLPLADLNEFNVTEADLWSFKHSGLINSHFVELMKYQIKRARKYGDRGEILMNELFCKLDADCRFILDLLISLYKKTIDRIEKVEYNVFNEKHGISMYEIFRTTFHNAMIHSFGKLKTIRFGLSLLKKLL